MVDEIDQDHDVQQQHCFGDRDAEVRHEGAVGIEGYRTKSEYRVGERANEDAEGDLIANVANEVSHHPRAELLGRLGER